MGDAKKQNTRTLQQLAEVRESKERYKRKCAVNKQSLETIPAKKNLLRYHINRMAQKLFIVIADRGETQTKYTLTDQAYKIIASWWNESVEDIEKFHYPSRTFTKFRIRK